MTTQPGNVIDAMGAIGKAIEKLSEEERLRALQGVAIALGLTLDCGHDSRRLGMPGGEQSSPSEGSRKLSIAEYLNDTDPATNDQRIAVFAAYRSDVEGIDRFTRRDLEAYFSKARLAPPANFDRDYNKAVKAGWIHDNGAESYLTATGESKVRDGFGGKARARGTAVTKKRKKKSTRSNS